MTNHWIDIRNSDCILIMGSNAASNHPISFKWVTEAMKRGGKLISVDPRFTQTSAKADFYTALRSGTDIAFLGGMIKYILDNNKYVAGYTNAAFIIADSYDFNDGLFSGYDAEKRKYDKSKWGFVKDEKGIPKKDRTLQDPRCVFQLIKKHYSRYNMDTVSAITGTPKEDLAEMYSTTGQQGKAGTIMYAMGWTQHTVGVQNIRSMAIIQLLLGNMGVAGGGVNALRGESNVQGSTDHCILFHIWPGYLKTPKASQPTLAAYWPGYLKTPKASQPTLAAYNNKYTPKTSDPLSANWWGNYPKYSVSLLKSFFGDKATKANDFGYNWLPKLDDGVTYSWLDLFDAIYKGELKGLFAWGMNPAASGANANKNRQGMAKLDWMVNVNIFDNETGSFWKGPGMDPKKIKTEVFMLPCATSVEKEGSITNSGRWMQWRYKAANPPAEALPDGQILMRLGKALKYLYKKDKNAVFPEPIVNLKWDYSTHGEFDAHKMAKEINGYFLKDITVKGKKFKKGDLVPSFAYLQADGSTSSANWLYCNSYTSKGNMSARRKREKSGIGLNLEWAWCWPVNRRIIYNRASVDKSGKPWDKEHPVIEFKGKVENGKYVSKKWVGDVPDGGWYPMQNPDGSDRKDTNVFGPGRADGPFSEHYEPVESPVSKQPFSSQLASPVAVTYDTNMDIYESGNPKYPYVCSTYRVCDHWQTGVMTRWQPWLLEAQPQLFVELSKELGRELGIKNGEKVIVESARGKVEAVAMVTIRLKPFNIQGKTVHQVGLPWHFGWVHPKDGGDSANLLTPSAGDPNTRIPETKAFMVNMRKA